MNFSTLPPKLSAQATHALVVRRQHRPDVLWVEALGPRREADEVDEEHRDDAPLLAASVRLPERCPAREAEPRAFGVLLLAVGAGWRHLHRLEA